MLRFIQKRLPGLLALGVWSLVWASAGADPVSARPERAVILLGCAQASDPICQAMIQELAHKAPGRVPRIVPPGQDSPSRPGDLGLRLEQQAHQARLLWIARNNPDNVKDKGAWIPLKVTESPLSVDRARQTARALLGHFPAFLSELDEGQSGTK
ncbi:hypothetical protein TRP8649_00923 [Pelagimonas phthalicica]|uniref:Uncharacterized protein n=1 Tax=Pelagimonas phthalicica TaxID=1037362 RepID=A0A238J7Z0_9RHOB|nr:hypothetical protein [Pelagimonas phthalicica]TDS94642.1 hypothetical protein CLV87_1148 [Pelagimonas phthalicica]SMX26830.1 hypothetical protein TRP8649_00923 [Pelagimonas phthalicica]